MSKQEIRRTGALLFLHDYQKAERKNLKDHVGGVLPTVP